MIGHDLIDFPNARISLTSIHAVITEPSEPGIVYVDYGHGNRIGFEGDVEDVMKLIDNYVAAANG
jgi:hypothetical protein